LDRAHRLLAANRDRPMRITTGETRPRQVPALRHPRPLRRSGPGRRGTHDKAGHWTVS